MLKFGIFKTHNNEKVTPMQDTKKNYNLAKFGRTVMKTLALDQVKKPKNEAEQLVEYLTYFLEYDRNYFLSLQALKIFRQFDDTDQNQNAQELLNSIMRSSMNQGVKTLKSIFTTEVSSEKE